MDSIKSIVSQVIGNIASGSGGSCQEIERVWQRISKDPKSTVAGIKNGCVTIKADSSMRLFKLNLNRENFLKELQKEFPTVQKIYFKVGT